MTTKDPDSAPTDGPRAANGPSRDRVAAQIERIVSSPEFRQSERSRRFLEFVVEEALAGRAGGLKEYTIALEVFDRDESFDPRTNSIVRVEASRLRAKLRHYYADMGRADPLRIALPTGGYIPAFHAPERRDAPSPVRRFVFGTRRFGPARAVLAIAFLVVLAGLATVLLIGLFRTGPDADPPTGASEPDAIRSLAVLPLRNLSGDAGQDYFSDGITDALIASLAKEDFVRVISLTSAMAYKNVNRPIAEIARELNVSHVIEGSVLRIDDKVRITAQLIEAEADRHLWAESYERDAADVLAIQDEVVRRVVSSLSGQAALTGGRGATDMSAVDPAAHEAQLRGRFFRNQMTEEGFRKSIAYFRRAIETQPDYALAYSGMASCFCLLSGQGFELVRPHDAMPTAKEAALKAIDLDATLAEPHAFLGFIRLKYEWDWAGAEESLRHSMDLNPSFAQAWLFYSIFHEAMGRREAAIEAAERARTIDPLSLAANVNLGWQFLRADRLEEAKALFESTAELNPDFWSVHWGLGHYYRRKAMYDEAIAAFQAAVDAQGGHTLPLRDLGYTYAAAGRPAEAREVLGRLEALAGEGYVSPYNMATIHVGLGETDEAFAWLEKAFEERARSLVWLKVAREYDGLRSDPRLEALVRRVGLPS